MDLGTLITYTLAAIGGISSIITIITTIFPNTASSLLSPFLKIVTKRRLRKEKINLKINYDYQCKNITEHPINYKKDIEKIFKNLITKQEINLIEGNIDRRDFYINMKLRTPVDNETSVHLTQKTTITFKKFDSCMSTLFDNIRDLMKLDYIEDSYNNVNIRVTSSFFNDNEIIKLLGPKVRGSFAIEKKDDETTVIYNGYLVTETIDSVSDIIVAIAEL